MNYEQFAERRNRDFYKEGHRLWCFVLQYRNILAPPSRHVPPTEVELGAYSRLMKVSAKTGRTLHSAVNGFSASLYDDDVRHHPESGYLIEMFDTKEECLAGYRACLDFWIDVANQRQEAQNRDFDRQRENIQAYFDKIQ